MILILAMLDPARIWKDASSKNGTRRRNLFDDRSLRFSPVDEEFGADARANALHGRNSVDIARAVRGLQPFSDG
jgi:hypothetical protein